MGSVETSRILIVDDEEGMREFLELMLLQKGYKVTTASSGEEALKALHNENFDLVISDIKMEPLNGLHVLREARKINPDIAVVMISAYASTETAIEAMKEGAFDYLPKPFDIDEIYQIIEEVLKKKQSKTFLSEAPGELNESKRTALQLHFGLLIGESPQMMKVYDLIERVAQVDSNILITGESGTGKELVARAIHNLSHRKNYTFVAVNCGGVPESLIESELFGYRKGAFTGATQDKKGLVESAQKGTLFLDEVGELSPSIQIKLLRLIQEKTIRRLGDTEDHPVDVRIIAATHRNLEEMVIKGDFREDLYYRLNVIPIKLPALRDRKEDIPLLANFFLNQYSTKLGKNIQKLSSYAMDILKSYEFPGNVRELENIIERGVALEQTRIVLPDSLKIATHRFYKKSRTEGTLLEDLLEFPAEGIDLDKFLERIEKHYLTQALVHSKGNRHRAARLLRITFRSIRYRLAKYGLEAFAVGDDHNSDETP